MMGPTEKKMQTQPENSRHSGSENAVQRQSISLWQKGSYLCRKGCSVLLAKWLNLG